MFQSCLICTDFEDGLHRLTKFVPSLAACGFNRIVFMHSVPLRTKTMIPKPDEKRMDEARERLQVDRENIPEGVEVRSEVVSGEPVDCILKVAADHGSQLLMVGASNRSMLAESLFGSTTVELSDRVEIPILTVPEALVSALTDEELDLRCRHLYRHLLLPYNDSAASQQLTKYLQQHLRDRGLGGCQTCLLSWVIETGGPIALDEYQKSQQEAAREKIDQVKEELASLGLQVTTDVRLGKSVVDLLELARMSNICAIAISSDKLGKYWRFALPSVAAEVLRRSFQPVLFFPTLEPDQQ
ncbi:universal stress protein [Geitlerinema sp. PCC 9228]|jgi:nucleotide-binding universal stress UspA family protein|uniref:universal stress protein n=1 Tax=Geitlerinema sp. PCC 9228 TaxID=111611 RepID=UPI0008F9A49B|nr:universal stress protein [Geitlerinema sp. PCC 9228]